MKYLHSMLRIRDVDESLHFFCKLLGLLETRRKESPEGRFTLIFLATAPGEPEVELTYNWDVPDSYGNARNFGHLAYEVDDIHEICHRLQAGGVTILRPPRDGRMAFVKSPDGISIELLQKGPALAPAEPWASMPNTGSW
ncbi:VOC family protein [Oligoflexus tunisiensis]|uniref:VOC family protein n=1 Tax=Oligoflexus tunisiensis TaxID=708132 RepID=UPI000B047291|nr:VOC family protein [Oligoflexus tunisiensis]